MTDSTWASFVCYRYGPAVRSDDRGIPRTSLRQSPPDHSLGHRTGGITETDAEWRYLSVVKVLSFCAFCSHQRRHDWSGVLMDMNSPVYCWKIPTCSNRELNMPWWICWVVLSACARLFEPRSHVLLNTECETFCEVFWDMGIGYAGNSVWSPAYSDLAQWLTWGCPFITCMSQCTDYIHKMLTFLAGYFHLACNASHAKYSQKWVGIHQNHL